MLNDGTHPKEKSLTPAQVKSLHGDPVKASSALASEPAPVAVIPAEPTVAQTQAAPADAPVAERKFGVLEADGTDKGKTVMALNLNDAQSKVDAGETVYEVGGETFDPNKKV